MATTSSSLSDLLVDSSDDESQKELGLSSSIAEILAEDDDVAARRAEMRAVKAVRQQQVAAARVDAIEARLNVTKTRDGKDSS